MPDLIERLYRLALPAFLCAAPLNARPQSDANIPANARPTTFCNPLDLDYRFQPSTPTRREAADPTIVRFKGEYWLFASKSGGYWHSADLLKWKFVEPTGLPIEDYSPTGEVIDGRMYFTAFNSDLYSTDDPAAGNWAHAAKLAGYRDPDLFLDDDGKLYCYFGCSHNGAIQVVELDPAHDFKVVRGPVICFPSDPGHHGFEVPGEQNRGANMADGRLQMEPWTEGSWMTKHAGIYYLQYASPGAQFKSYADGVYTSTNPMGPFAYAPYSPFSHKPTGFIGGAGHSSTFKDGRGHYWHVTTMSISVRHMFERRLGLFPAGFTPDGQLFCDTYLGDYPQFAPGFRNDSATNNSPGWMLLSYAKPATASSTLDSFPAKNAFDENVRTWWSATSGNSNEWLRVDLKKACRIEAIQINFADQQAKTSGRSDHDFYCYYVETSMDDKTWSTCIDRGQNFRVAPHEYTQLDQPLMARYVRLVNVHTPFGGFFSVSGFRVFGNGLGKPPDTVGNIRAKRNPTDPRCARVSWSPVEYADFYIVRYGIARDRLFNSYQVYGSSRLDINGLNQNVAYYLTVDAVNDSGVTQGLRTVEIR